MNKLFYFIIIALILLAGSTLAVPESDISIGEFGLEMSFPPFESGVYGQDLTFPFHVFNRYDGFPVTNGLTCCTFELYNSNGVSFYEHKQFLTDGSAEAYFPITAENFTYEGGYSFLIHCNGTINEHHIVAGAEAEITAHRGGFKAVPFVLTTNGLTIDGNDTFLTFIWALFIISVLSSLAVIIITIAKIAGTDETVYDVLIAWGSFILLLITHYLANYYLVDGYIETITGLLLVPVGLTNIFLPIIALIITMFYKGSKKGRPLSPEELNGRGLY